MVETRKCITEFNHQFEVVKHMKRRIEAAKKLKVPVVIACANETLSNPCNSDSINNNISASTMGAAGDAKQSPTKQISLIPLTLPP